jgi:pimeloyl-ACP methyl ester carboxylesterase
LTDRTRAVVLAAGVAGATGKALGAYGRWACEERHCLALGSHVASTTRGRVEYAEEGSGPPLLISHGTSGGYDQGLWLARALNLKDVRVIAASRAGYLRTPLASGRTPEAMANVFARLLDELGINRAAVLGYSAGGPTALQFALRHTDRCAGLVLLSAVSRRVASHAIVRAGSRMLFKWQPGFPIWLAQGMGATRTLAAHVALRALVNQADLRRLVLRDETQARLLADRVQSLGLPSLRRAGNLNDERCMAEMAEYPLAHITVPTLVVHGRADMVVVPDDAVFAARSIPGAVLLMLERGAHMLPLTHGVAGLSIGGFLARDAEFQAPDFGKVIGLP